MTFWWTTLSALIAAIAAGIILKVIFQRKKPKEIGVIQIDQTTVKDSEIDSNVKAKRTEISGVGNINVNHSKISGSKIKGKISLDE